MRRKKDHSVSLVSTAKKINPQPKAVWAVKRSPRIRMPKRVPKRASVLMRMEAWEAEVYFCPMVWRDRATMVLNTVTYRIPPVSYTHLDVYKRQGEEVDQSCKHYGAKGLVK